MRFKHQFDPNYKGSSGTSFMQPALDENGDPQVDTKTGEVIMEKMASKTEPNQAMTIPQLIANSVKGLPTIAPRREAHYFGVEIPNISDMTDLVEAREALDNAIAEAEKTIGQELQEKAKAKLDAYFKENPPKAQPEVPEEGGPEAS